jgi:hypothetical protein
MRQRKEKLEREIRNFSQAIAEAGHSKYLLEEISAREREIGTITDRLLSAIAGFRGIAHRGYSSVRNEGNLQPTSPA